MTTKQKVQPPGNQSNSQGEPRAEKEEKKDRKISRTTNIILAIFAIVTAGIMTWQSYQTQQSLDLAKQTLSIDQRAWVVLEGISGDLVAGKSYVVKVQMKNSGNTPAIMKGGGLRVDPKPTGQEPDFSDYGEIDTPAVLGPNSSYLMLAVSPFIPEQVDVDQVKSGKMQVFIHGTVFYRDIFGKDHWTKFCSTLRQDFRGYLVCKKHNEMDNN